MHISPRALQRETILDLFRSLQNLIKFVCEQFIRTEITSQINFFGVIFWFEWIHSLHWMGQKRIKYQFSLQNSISNPQTHQFSTLKLKFPKKLPPIQCTELVGPKKGQPIQCTEFEVPFFNKPIQCTELVGQKGHFWIQCTELVGFSWIYCFFQNPLFFAKFCQVIHQGQLLAAW